jgi:hypothetical protein
MNRLIPILFVLLLVQGARAEAISYSALQKQWGLAPTAILIKRNYEGFYLLTETSGYFVAAHLEWAHDTLAAGTDQRQILDRGQTQ